MLYQTRVPGTATKSTSMQVSSPFGMDLVTGLHLYSTHGSS